MVARYGAVTVKAAMREIIDDTSAAVFQRLQRIPDGTWHDVTYLGALTKGDRRAHRVTMTMTKTGDQLVFSNEGTEAGSARQLQRLARGARRSRTRCPRCSRGTIATAPAEY